MNKKGCKLRFSNPLMKKKDWHDLNTRSFSTMVTDYTKNDNNISLLVCNENKFFPSNTQHPTSNVQLSTLATTSFPRSDQTRPTQSKPHRRETTKHHHTPQDEANNRHHPLPHHLYHRRRRRRKIPQRHHSKGKSRRAPRARLLHARPRKHLRETSLYVSVHPSISLNLHPPRIPHLCMHACISSSIFTISANTGLYLYRYG